MLSIKVIDILIELRKKVSLLEACNSFFGNQIAFHESELRCLKFEINKAKQLSTPEILKDL